MKIGNIWILWAAALLVITSCKSDSNKTSSSDVRLSPKQEARFSMSEDIATLDPRKARGLNAMNIVRLIYDGLMRLENDGKVGLSLAEEISVSPDQKTYTFRLKDTKWSNEDPVLASDFEYSWKSCLKSDMSSPHAYQFFVIKNAKRAFDNVASLDEVGIRAEDARTLVVELENPTPYFLQLVASAPYFPINQKWQQEHPDNKVDDKFVCVSNGAFVLSDWKPHFEIVLKKNPFYWQQNDVKLERARFSVLDDYTSLTLFEKNELDWTGSPTSIIPPDAIASLKKEGKVHFVPAAGTQFLRVNIENAPLNNVNFRQALLLASNRQAIVDHIMQSSQQVAASFVPPCMGLSQNSYFATYDLNQAKELFQKALSEMGIEKKDLPPISLSFVAGDRMQKIAQSLQQDWKQAFDIDVQMQGTEAKTFYENIFNKNYQLAAGTWFADFYDPISFLSVFQYRENGTNNTGWNNNEYTKLLEKSSFQKNQERRYAMLDEAQSILMKELPILPLFHFNFSYLQSDELQGAALTELGQILLQKAFIIAKENPQTTREALPEDK